MQLLTVFKPEHEIGLSLYFDSVTQQNLRVKEMWGRRGAE